MPPRDACRNTSLTSAGIASVALVLVVSATGGLALGTSRCQVSGAVQSLPDRCLVPVSDSALATRGTEMVYLIARLKVIRSFDLVA
jgi:hypothetical protein